MCAANRHKNITSSTHKIFKTLVKILFANKIPLALRANLQKTAFCERNSTTSFLNKSPFASTINSFTGDRIFHTDSINIELPILKQDCHSNKHHEDIVHPFIHPISMKGIIYGFLAAREDVPTWDQSSETIGRAIEVMLDLDSYVVVC